MLVLGGSLASRALVTMPCNSHRGHRLRGAPVGERSRCRRPAKAYAAVRPSVVRVVGLDDENEEPPKPGDDPKAHTRSTGTGVVIVDNGTILTNLHVVVGAKRIRVTFFDGHESEASMVGAQPENDLAVLRAKSIPDDLQAPPCAAPATSCPATSGRGQLPFGISPSASAGGCQAEAQLPRPGRRALTSLISSMLPPIPAIRADRS
jgi:S1-C subfamily serine protease